MKVSAFGQRSVAAALAVLWFLAHLLFLAPSLEDIDSINFALGLRHFDPALHQPHPPGYPVYIALGRTSLAVIERVAPSMAPERADALALAIWSAICGALAIVAAARLFAAVGRRDHNTDTASSSALWASALLAVSPLFWMSGLRPMSDMAGLAGVLWAQALALEGRVDRRRLIAAAAIAGLAGGIRVQTLPLTLPLLVFACIEARAWWRPLAGFAVGTIAWAVPLVVATGGITAYRQALGVQAAEDFGWVDMVLSNPTPRRIAFSLYETFVLPWAWLPLAIAIGVCAVAGSAALLLRRRMSIVLMVIAFVPYIPYHLLLQETVTVRYALPIVPLMAWLAIQGLVLARRWMPLVAVPLLGSALIVAAAGGIAYGREPHPAFRAIADADRRAESMPPAATYSHYGLRRPLQAAASPALRIVEPRRNYEWLGLADYWRGGGTDPVWFFADPKRTDLALIDPYARRDVVRYRWPAEDRAELSGTRPLGVDWYRLPPPGWFAGEGWSLTPEAGGITRATASGPDYRPIEAWVRRRAEPMHMMVGGRHLGDPRDPAAEFELVVNGALIDRWRLTAAEQNFLRFVDLPQGIPAPSADGDTYAHLLIASRTADGDARRVEVAIRQFDVQPSTRVIFGFGDGWHEEEYAPQTGLRWRWTSERSMLRLKGPAQPVRLAIRGESPLKYVDAAPTVKVVAGQQVVGAFTPRDDFEWSVVIPAAAWAASGGAVAIETDRIYLPGPAEGTSDARHLGLRLYEIRVDPVEP